MSYDPNKLTKLAALKALAEKTKAATDALGVRVKTLEDNTYTKEQVDSKISSVYKPGGSVAFVDLPAADAAHEGYVYNVTDGFTTTADFAEGAGKKHPAGTNVVIVVTSAAGAEPATYGYDVLAGFVDLSGLQPKEEGKGLSANDYTDAEKAKLAGVAEGATKVEASTIPGNIKINGSETPVVDVATDAEVAEMLNEVFGAADNA